MSYRIEPMRLTDIAQVMEIEKVSFPTGWPASAFRRELRENRLARYLVLLHGTDRPPAALAPRGDGVARDLAAVGPPPVESAPSAFQRLTSGLQRLVSPPPVALAPPHIDRTIAGYVGLWLMVDEAHITTIAVAPSHRGRGLGEHLLVAAFDIATALEADVVTLEVRVSNAPAIRLYEKYTFRRVGIRKNYYTDTHEDALIMTTGSIADADFRALLDSLRRANADRIARY
jgi:ribosomal-protein-alanine N-acetyltransferase